MSLPPFQEKIQKYCFVYYFVTLNIAESMDAVKIYMARILGIVTIFAGFAYLGDEAQD